MIRTIRVFLLLQGAVFIAAASTHLGVPMSGYEHREAGIAESVIGSVLLAGLILTSILPASTRAIGITVQSFALLGTAVGIVMIGIGVGPRTIPDIVLHVVLVMMLLTGLVTIVKTQRGRER